jgi:hypothetical protein
MVLDDVDIGYPASTGRAIPTWTGCSSMEMPVTSAAATGLTNAEAQRRLAEFGPNAVGDEAAPR